MCLALIQNVIYKVTSNYTLRKDVLKCDTEMYCYMYKTFCVDFNKTCKKKKKKRSLKHFMCLTI